MDFCSLSLEHCFFSFDFIVVVFVCVLLDKKTTQSMYELGTINRVSTLKREIDETKTPGRHISQIYGLQQIQF